MSSRIELRAAAALTLSFALVTLNAPGARADDAPPASKDDRALELFREAKGAAAQKDWARAYTLFYESYELSPSHDTAANLGHVSLKLQRAADAARFLSIALKRFPVTGEKEKRAELENYVALALRHVALIRIEVTPADAQVLVNSAPVGRASVIMEQEGALFLEPGRQVIEFSLEGYTPHTESVVAEPAMQRTISVVLERATPGGSAATGPTTAAPTTSPSSYPPAPTDAGGESRPNLLVPILVGGGITLAALGVGIGFTLAASSADSDADALERELGNDSSCGAGTPFVAQCAELKDRRDAVGERSTVATIAFVGAGVAAIGTAAYVWVVSNRGGSGARRSPFYARQWPRVDLSPKGVTLSLSGIF
jgi:hypothetical protein